jgi:hypothetical protein
MRPTVTRRAVLCPGDADSDAEAARIALLANVANVRATAVAKLDRLSRDGHFISGLMAQRVPFLHHRPEAGV